MNRRSFLGWLSAMPVVAFFKPPVSAQERFIRAVSDHGPRIAWTPRRYGMSGTYAYKYTWYRNDTGETIMAGSLVAPDQPQREGA